MYQNQLENHLIVFCINCTARLVMITSEYYFEELLLFWSILPRTARCWHHNNDVLLLCKLAHFNFLVVADRFSSTAASIQTNQGGTLNYHLLVTYQSKIILQTNSNLSLLLMSNFVKWKAFKARMIILSKGKVYLFRDWV